MSGPPASWTPRVSSCQSGACEAYWIAGVNREERRAPLPLDRPVSLAAASHNSSLDTAGHPPFTTLLRVIRLELPLIRVWLMCLCVCVRARNDVTGAPQVLALETNRGNAARPRVRAREV